MSTKETLPAANEEGALPADLLKRIVGGTQHDDKQTIDSNTAVAMTAGADGAGEGGAAAAAAPKAAPAEDKAPSEAQPSHQDDADKDAADRQVVDLQQSLVSVFAAMKSLQAVKDATSKGARTDEDVTSTHGELDPAAGKVGTANDSAHEPAKTATDLVQEALHKEHEAQQRLAAALTAHHQTSELGSAQSDERNDNDATSARQDDVEAMLMGGDMNKLIAHLQKLTPESPKAKDLGKQVADMREGLEQKLVSKMSTIESEFAKAISLAEARKVQESAALAPKLAEALFSTIVAQYGTGAYQGSLPDPEVAEKALTRLQLAAESGDSDGVRAALYDLFGRPAAEKTGTANEAAAEPLEKQIDVLLQAFRDVYEARQKLTGPMAALDQTSELAGAETVQTLDFQEVTESLRAGLGATSTTDDLKSAIDGVLTFQTTDVPSGVLKQLADNQEHFRQLKEHSHHKLAEFGAHNDARASVIAIAADDLERAERDVRHLFEMASLVLMAQVPFQHPDRIEETFANLLQAVEVRDSDGIRAALSDLFDKPAAEKAGTENESAMKSGDALKRFTPALIDAMQEALERYAAVRGGGPLTLKGAGREREDDRAS